MGEALAGTALHWRARVGSTQDAARDLLRHEALPFAVATDDQRAGRGRLRRTWTMPPGAGLALTVALRPSIPQQRWGRLPGVVGLAVLETLEAGAADDAAPGTAGPGLENGTLGLKWPNDVLALRSGRMRKLAGILIEPDGEGRALIGVGVNLAAPSTAPPEVLAGAAWLHGEGGLLPHGPTRSAPELAAALSARILARARQLEEELRDAAPVGGSPESPLASLYAERCFTLGRRVRADLIGHPRGAEGTPGAEERRPTAEGVAIGCDADGRLLIREDDGRTVAVDAAEVHHLRPRPDPDAPGGQR